MPEVLDNLGIVVKWVDGHDHWASCPLSSHQGADAKPSFSVSDTELIWGCFSCSEGGTLPNLVMDILGLSWDQAVDWLTEFSEDVFETDDSFARQIEKHLLRNEVKEAPEPLPWFSTRVIEKWVDTPTPWFELRGITEASRQQFKLGFDPEHVQTSKSGREYVGPAAIFPHFFNGQCVGYQQRWLDQEECAEIGIDHPGRPTWIPKYKNTDNFPKKTTLFNYDPTQTEVIVVEGTVTPIKLTQMGYYSVSTFGASITPEQWRLLQGFGRVFLSLDNDDPGYKAMKAGVKALCEHTDVWIIDPPRHEKGANLADVSDEVARQHIENAYPGFLELDVE
jgi:DNA primase